MFCLTINALLLHVPEYHMMDMNIIALVTISLLMVSSNNSNRAHTAISLLLLDRSIVKRWKSFNPHIMGEEVLGPFQGTTLLERPAQKTTLIKAICETPR